MTVEEAEVILRKLCPDLTVSTRPHKGVTEFRGTLTTHPDSWRKYKLPIRVQHKDGKWVFMNGHERNKGFVETLHGMIYYAIRDRSLDIGNGVFGTVRALMGYGPAFDWEGVGVYFDVVGANVRRHKIGWADDVHRYLPVPTAHAVTSEMRAMAAAIVSGDDSAVGGLVDYLIEYSPEFATIWDEATEWAARVATGTVMRPLDPPDPAVGNAL